MKSSHAERLASLILDDWPLPQVVKRWIEAQPDVAKQIAVNQALENRLRLTANLLDQPPARVPAKVEPVHGHAAKVNRFKIALLTAAAASLVTIGWYVVRQRDTLAVVPRGQQATKAVDLQPLIASINAGEQIAVNLSAGLEDLASQFLEASEKFTKSPFRSERKKKADRVGDQEKQPVNELD
ncbi:hypothetical protein SH139x_000040 [Planctomycetaceae bacterium SH139]